MQQSQKQQKQVSERAMNAWCTQKNENKWRKLGRHRAELHAGWEDESEVEHLMRLAIEPGQEEEENELFHPIARAGSLKCT